MPSLGVCVCVMRRDVAIGGDCYIVVVAAAAVVGSGGGHGRLLLAASCR